jgi:hypothetical protein
VLGRVDLFSCAFETEITKRQSARTRLCNKVNGLFKLPLFFPWGCVFHLRDNASDKRLRSSEPVKGFCVVPRLMRESVEYVYQRKNGRNARRDSTGDMVI